jgi:hypothetical protein
LKLKLQRSQKTTMFRGTPVFQLHAIVDVSPDERAMIGKYGLGSTIVYASEQWQNISRWPRPAAPAAMGAS